MGLVFSRATDSKIASLIVRGVWVDEWPWKCAARALNNWCVPIAGSVTLPCQATDAAIAHQVKAAGLSSIPGPAGGKKIF